MRLKKHIQSSLSVNVIYPYPLMLHEAINKSKKSPDLGDVMKNQYLHFVLSDLI